jgi:transcriptional regulator with XRE-family HTH domain
MDFDRVGFDRQVGLRVQRARKAAGMTQEEVAKRIGIPRPSYANVESGRQRIPLDVLWRAAIVLQTDISKLVPQPEYRRRRPAEIVRIRPTSAMLPAAVKLPSTTTSILGSSDFTLPGLLQSVPAIAGEHSDD